MQALTKRRFLSAAALGAVALPAVPTPAQAQQAALRNPVLLTVTGTIGKGNRGPLDPVLDQLMAKQKLKFDRGYAFDFAAVAALPAITIKPTLEYDAKPHTLKGPLILDVLKAAGAKTSESTRVLMRAIDGYAAPITVADLRNYRFIVATHLDGHPMPLGGLGPLWAVYDADRHADMTAKPVTERFALCPWGLYHLEVVPT